MPIKHVHKSLANINEKNVLFYQLSSIVTQRKSKSNSSMSALFVELISVLVNASMYFNYDFDVSLLHKHLIQS